MLQTFKDKAKKSVNIVMMITSKNYAPHLVRKHSENREVNEIFEYPKNSNEQTNASLLLRNGTIFELYFYGTTRPNFFCL